MTPPRTSWSGTVRYRVEHVEVPTDVDAVRRAVTAHDHVRVLGTGHTFNELPDTVEAISLERMRDVEVVGDAVEVGGGATFSDVATALRPHDLALANLASLPHITVAGAVATGTHGSGLDAPNLASMVRAVDLVTADGELHPVRRGDDDFPGSVVALGALGVVTRLELDVVPARDHRQVVLTGLAATDLAESIDTVMRLGRSVSVFTRWDDTPARLWVKRRDDDVGDLPGEWPAATTEQHPIDGLDTVNTTPQLDVPGWWADRLPHFRMGFTPSVGNEVQSEYHVARAHAPAAVEALRAVGDRFADVLQVSEIRSVAADELWLSPQHQRASTSFHFTWIGDRALATAATRVVEDALAPFDPRPHWGKLFTLDPRSSYPRLPDFLALRDRLDPTGRFVNPWLQRTLGL